MTQPTDPEEVELLMRMAGWAQLRMRVSGQTLGMRIMDYGAIDDAATGYGYTPEHPRPSHPGASEITMMDEVSSWLGFVPEAKMLVRRVVALRMLYDDEKGRCLYSYERIAKRLGCTRMSVRGAHKEGLKTISRHLNQHSRLLEKIWLWRNRLDGP